MIEVEVKFSLTKEEKNSLLKDSKFISKENLEDIYFDNKDYSLSLADIWIRSRNKKFLLKLPVKTIKKVKTQYNTPKKEISDEKIIRNFFQIPKEITDLKRGLILKGYKPLYKFTTTREKYIKNNFTIDIDYSNFGNTTYSLCEIELIIKKIKDYEEAIKKIEFFAQKHDLKISKVEGKLIKFIKTKNPLHYSLLKTRKNLPQSYF